MSEDERELRERCRLPPGRSAFGSTSHHTFRGFKVSSNNFYVSQIFHFEPSLDALSSRSKVISSIKILSFSGSAFKGEEKKILGCGFRQEEAPPLAPPTTPAEGSRFQAQAHRTPTPPPADCTSPPSPATTVCANDFGKLRKSARLTVPPLLETGRSAPTSTSHHTYRGLKVLLSGF